MKEERMEILNMLRDGVISVEEAEKLLSALDDGDKKSRDKSDREDRFNRNSRRGSRHGSDFFADFDRGFASFGKAMGDIFGEFADRGRFHDFDFVNSGINSLVPEEGDSVRITHMGKRMFRSGCDIRLVPSEDGAIHADPSDGRSCEIMKKEGKIAILCGEDCTISLPVGLTEVSVHLFNGNISARAIEAPVDLETFNGDISIADCPRPGLIKTLSGDIEAALARDHNGHTDLHTVSGDLELLLPGSFSGIVETSTISGHIDCHIEENLSASSGVYTIGTGDEANRINCKTVSGDLEIDHADTE